MARIVANLNGGDETTPDNELIFKIYGDADNYTTAIATTGNAINDANVSVAGGVVTILNVDVTGQGNIKLTSIDAEGNESNQSVAFATIQTFYVRPATTAGTYGTEDGTSYANAFNGDAGIDYNICRFNIIEVCDIHTQGFSIPVSDITFKFDGTNPGSIDATSINAGIGVNGVDNFTIIEPDIQNAIIQNIYWENCNNCQVIGGNCSSSGNQGDQNWEGADVTYINHTSNNNGDEGISGHLFNNNITVVGGQYKNSKNNFINTVDGVVSNISEFWDGGNNGVDINIGKSIAPSPLTTSICNVSNSYIRGINVTQWGRINASNCYIKANSFIVKGHLQLKRCIIDCANATGTNMWDIETEATIDINHCVFINVPTTISQLLIIRPEATVLSLDNNTFYSTLQASTAIFSAHANLITNNNIYVGFNQAIFANTGSFTDNNGVYHNNTTNNGGTATSLVNPLIADPLLTNPATLDFSLQTGSPAIGYGLTLANNLGIESGVWGDGTAFAPSVVEKQQTAPFDCGAYVD